MAKKNWHQKHISTKWGIAIIAVLLIGLAIAIPQLSKNQDLRSKAATYDDSRDTLAKGNSNSNSQADANRPPIIAIVPKDLDTKRLGEGKMTPDHEGLFDIVLDTRGRNIKNIVRIDFYFTYGERFENFLVPDDYPKGPYLKLNREYFENYWVNNQVIYYMGDDQGLSNILVKKSINGQKIRIATLSLTPNYRNSEKKVSISFDSAKTKIYSYKNSENPTLNNYVNLPLTKQSTKVTIRFVPTPTPTPDPLEKEN